MINFLLLLVSIVISLITYPLAISYTIFKAAIDKKLGSGYMSYRWLEMAISIDKVGNAICYDLLNKICILKSSKHKFGIIRETISSVLGKNKKDKTLTDFGVALSNLLNWLDKHHVEESITWL